MSQGENAWKVYTSKWEIRQVFCPEGMEYPKKDAEGDTIYLNTHFKTYEEAVECLRANAKAHIESCLSAIEQHKTKIEENKNLIVNASKALLIESYQSKE